MSQASDSIYKKTHDRRHFDAKSAFTLASSWWRLRPKRNHGLFIHLSFHTYLIMLGLSRCFWCWLRGEMHVPFFTSSWLWEDHRIRIGRWVFESLPARMSAFLPACVPASVPALSRSSWKKIVQQRKTLFLFSFFFVLVCLLFCFFRQGIKTLRGRLHQSIMISWLLSFFSLWVWPVTQNKNNNSNDHDNDVVVKISGVP